ncbi:MAG: hypothetical protein SH857_14480 [Chitinophagales bacterium]|nr:hypothetical protein [Chitinophagales bacterium]
MPKKKTTPKEKIKTKPLKRLPKKLGDDAYAYTAALLEDVNSNFRVFADNLTIVRDKVEGLSHEMGIVKEYITGIKISQELLREDVSTLKENVSTLKENVSTLKEDVRTLKVDFKEMNGRQIRMERDIQEIKQELKSIKSEMADIRILLSQKADIERFSRLEERVARIEQEIHLRQ